MKELLAYIWSFLLNQQPLMPNQLSLFVNNRSSKCELKVIDETIALRALRKSLENLPNENEEVLPGIKWGNSGQLYTPSFWKLQYLLSGYAKKQDSHKLTTSILEEVIMCLLGGYGIPSEMGILAFERLRNEKLIYPKIAYEDLSKALSTHFEMPDGRRLKYRFYNQKAKYICRFLNRNDLDMIPIHHDLKLRSWLLAVDGIGMKTASWITRNWMNSNRVAILDIHLIRAGILTGFFDENANVSVDYLKLERQYLNFCSLIQVPASDMDAIIWYIMKKSTKLARQTLISKPENKKVCPDLEMGEEAALLVAEECLM